MLHFSWINSCEKMTPTNDEIEAVKSQYDKSGVVSEESGNGVTNLGFIDTISNEITSPQVVGDVKYERDNNLNSDTRAPESPKFHRRSGQGAILLGACFSLFVAVGYPVSMGVLYVEWLDEFHSSRGETALIQSIYIGITFGGGLVVGVFIHRFGAWLTFLLGNLAISLGLFVGWFATSPAFLIVSVGIVSGAGGCMVFMSSTVIVSLTFKKTRSIAMTAMVGGGGIGAIVLPKLLQYLVDELGWRGSLLILSGIAFNLMIYATILRTRFFENTAVSITNSSSVHVGLVTQCRSLFHPLFCSYIFAASTSIGLSNSMVAAVVDFAETVGHNRDTGVIFLLSFNICQTVASISTGFIKMMPCTLSIVLLVFYMSLVSGFYVALSFLNGYAEMVACYLIMAVGHGGVAAMIPILMLEVSNEKLFPVAFGICGFCNGIVNAILGSVLGIIVDTMGSYTIPFRIYGAVGAFAALFVSLTYIVHQFATSKQSRIKTKDTVQVECISTIETEYFSDTRL